MKIAWLPLLVSVVALLLLLIGGPGYRLGLWDLGFGLMGVMRYALFAGAAGAILAIVFILIPKVRAGHATGLVAALILGGVVAAVPVQVRSIAQDLPFIHDITTDTTNPPEFVEVLPLRADAPNPPEYPGEEVADQQRVAYPGVQPFESDIAPGRMFEQALATAQDQGWALVAQDEADGRIEATDTTLWYGFKDDVVIRVRPSNGGSRLDIRSKSRVGGSDLGKNAQRIRAYLEDLERRLE